LQEQANCLDAMGLARSDVVLLAAGGHLDARAAEDLNVADNGAQAAVEQAEGEVFMGEQASLLARLAAEAQDAGAAQGDHTAPDADLEVVLAGIEGQVDRHLLARVDRLTGGLVGGDDQEFDLAESGLLIGILGVEGENLFGYLQNR
jgi:hypothetical protein